MRRKLYMLSVFSKSKVYKYLIDKYRMRNLYAIFANFLNICKQIAGNFVNKSGNVPRRGVVFFSSPVETMFLCWAAVRNVFLSACTVFE